MVPNGDTPDCVKNHPALKGVTIPQTGGLERAGMIVTKTLLFAGEGGGVRSPSGPLSGGPMFRAYDKKTGAVDLGDASCRSNQTGIPMTYMVERQAVHRRPGRRDRPARRADRSFTTLIAVRSRGRRCRARARRARRAGHRRCRDRRTDPGSRVKRLPCAASTRDGVFTASQAKRGESVVPPRVRDVPWRHSRGRRRIACASAGRTGVPRRPGSGRPSASSSTRLRDTMPLDSPGRLGAVGGTRRSPRSSSRRTGFPPARASWRRRACSAGCASRTAHRE